MASDRAFHPSSAVSGVVASFLSVEGWA